MAGVETWLQSTINEYKTLSLSVLHNIITIIIDQSSSSPNKPGGSLLLRSHHFGTGENGSMMQTFFFFFFFPFSMVCSPVEKKKRTRCLTQHGCQKTKAPIDLAVSFQINGKN